MRNWNDVKDGLPVRVGYSIEQQGLDFTITTVGIEVTNDSGLVAAWHTLDNHGLNTVKTRRDLEVEVAFWLNDNV